VFVGAILGLLSFFTGPLDADTVRAFTPLVLGLLFFVQIGVLGAFSPESVRQLFRLDRGHALSSKDMSDLRHFLTSQFSRGELKDLCFDLDIDYENLPGEAKGDKARELIKYAGRHGRLPELITAIQQLRPNAPHLDQENMSEEPIANDQDQAQTSDHETNIHGSVTGPVHTGTGNIIIQKAPTEPEPTGQGQLPAWLSRSGWNRILTIIVMLLLSAGATWQLPLLLSSTATPELEIIGGPTATKSHLQFSEQISVTVQTKGDGLIYIWSADNGTIEPAGETPHSTITYTAPNFSGDDVIRVEVRDKTGNTVEGKTVISVFQEP
jgi:hypothetical protein